MLDEVLGHLDPRLGVGEDGEAHVYVDATVGLGGHAEAILERSSPDGRLVGVDRDPAALALAAERLARFKDRCVLVHGDFSELRALLAARGLRAVDGLLCDLGVSSLQLDDAARGFSLRADGPLDMRMDPSSPRDAASVLDTIREADLVDALGRLGGERFAGRVARVVLERRRAGRLSTTGALRDAVHAALGRSRAGGIDAATRAFQALRMIVNHELEALGALLAELPGLLRPGGRAVFLSFHSGEDRLVKHALRGLAQREEPPRLRLLTRRAQRPSDAETAVNPRARSAKLRAIERLAEVA
ncbi:MAG: 16S rRNA (cytosine(1402)-N(4))-methyltransferase RsmH [Deltaproteobacteria bacterium]|nr:16S rRNA (cytosine(1402)-N(4))-methyltransferase RsmH [Deltaproteobacteria bacterium]